ncbi:MAG TPA: hypothetical protein DDY34_08590 [Bacteroidales bacterium]|nr:MAG: hypothetical protein A2X06_10305 [Bacteroidetes bacterium GWC2_40_22]HBH83848.1 hypothetical protein [Bacteroidales bacterium]
MEITSNKKEDFISFIKKSHSYLVLSILFILVFWGWQVLNNLAKKKEQIRFDDYCLGITRRINDRLHDIEMILRGAAGVFAASDKVTSADWAAYVKYKNLDELFPGTQALGFAEVINASELEDHIQSIKEEGHPDYKVWPVGDRDVYTSVIFIEPFDDWNKRFIGYDMFSEPLRRAAMEKCRDSAMTTMTDQIKLVQKTGNELKPGILIYVPIYNKDQPLLTIEDRRKAIKGYVFSELRIDVMFEEIFPDPEQEVTFEIYDSNSNHINNLLFPETNSPYNPVKEYKPLLSKNVSLKLYGRTWFLTLNSTPHFDALHKNRSFLILLIAGSIISILIFFLIRSGERVARRAQKLAGNMTVSLRKSEERFRSTLDNMMEGCQILDYNWKYLYINDAAVRHNRRPREELLGMEYAKMWPGIEQTEVYNVIKHCLINRVPHHMENEFAYPDGSLGCFDLSIQPVPEGVFILSIDISERKLVQIELDNHRLHLEELVKERSAELLLALEETRDLYENAPCGYHSLDSTGKFIRINSTELNWLGYSREEVIDIKYFTDFLTPESLKKFKESFPVFVDQGFINNLEFEFIRKDGSNFFAAVNASSVKDAAGNFIMSRSTLFDITDRKKAEFALDNAMKEAKSANRAKSEFLANMSHEIRTPMNAVLGYSELLGSTVTDQVQKNYISSIISSGRSLLTLINDILDLSKIEAGKLDLEFEFVDTRSFFSEFERIFSLRVSEKGLKFILEITSGTPPGIYIDEARVRQIVFNLLGNAVKFTNEGSIKLSVYTENPQIINYSKEKSGELIDLVIEVSDTGIGISEELKELIFEPFTQERSNKHTGGTGLGLTITKRLISLMNGSISFESEQGKGSTFIIKIPEISYLRDFSTTNTDIKINPDDIIFKEAVILIVDNVQHNRSYLKDALKNTQLKIIEAEDGFIGFKTAKELIPDLIIADIRMPKMDGFQLLSKLKSDKKLKHIPVIAYSASVLKDRKERIHNSKFSGLLIKPVNITELYLTLMNILPYSTTTKEDSNNLMTDTLVTGEIENLSDLILSLETVYHERWKTFAVTQPINEIHEFASALFQLGLKHNSQIIAAYGKELIDAADSFDIDTLLKLILKYKSIVGNLKNSFNDLK